MSQAIKMVKRIVPLTVCAALLAFASSASAAAPKWDIETLWGPTNLTPGDVGLITLQARNYGTASSSGTVTITDRLPEGVTWVKHKSLDPSKFQFPGSVGIDGPPWTCNHVLAGGIDTVTCTTTNTFENLSATSEGIGGLDTLLHLRIQVSPSATGTAINEASVSGGGAPEADTRVTEMPIDPTPRGFGIVPGSFQTNTGLFDARYPDGEPEEQAGGHPFELRTDFNFNMKTRKEANKFPELPGLTSDPLLIQAEDNAKTVAVTLPKGVIGNPEAVPKCTDEQFLGEGTLYLRGTACPSDTQVGYIDVNPLENDGLPFLPAAWTRVPIYNLVQPKGTPADFGFQIAGVYHGHIYASLDPAQGYRIKASSPAISSVLQIRKVRVTFWGVPGDPAHDEARTCPATDPCKNSRGYGAASGDHLHRPLLTMPMHCEADQPGFQLQAESWQNPGHFTPTETAAPIDVNGCDDQRIRFQPQVRLQPTSRSAGGPTGLDVHLEVPQRNEEVENPTDLYAKNGDVQAIPTPPMKKAVITLPEGMTLSTSAAQGLGTCSSAQIGIGTDSPVTCPEDSRYGGMTIHTPILPPDEPMVGDIFIAKKGDNPFNNFLSMYFVIHDESRGLLIKIPGRIDLNPKTGQIVTTFDELPQFPISDMQLTLKGGVRAALVNPSTCGTKTITAEFYSWSDPQTPVTRTSSYEVTQKPDGSPCVRSLAERPFHPELSAGTVRSTAGAYSPFAFRLTRTDDDQEFSQLSTTLPPGLLANISKVTECPEAGIAQAEAKGRSGIIEQLSPSCPASSLLGSTEVGSGVGQVITYLAGKAYLAGPYKGAPLSLVVITPIVAGPYDLGVIAVRSAIYVNGERAQARIQSDPFPQIYEGIPVRLRDIRVTTDRPGTTVNPTNCQQMTIGGHITGTGGDLDSTTDDSAVDLSQGFQVGSCGDLGFKPKLSFRLKGGTKRGDLPAFSATLKARAGDANIARTAVTLPPSVFLEQGHIRTVCTRVQFNAHDCPAGSIYGHAKATSPLFSETLEGPVYLRSNGGERLLPDLVVSLEGKINVVLAGFVDSLNGRIRNTFDVVPDAPVTQFQLSMQGGKKGLLINHRDLCTAPSRADVRLTGQNGKTYNTHPVVANSCKTKKHKKPGRGASR